MVYNNSSIAVAFCSNASLLTDNASASIARNTSQCIDNFTATVNDTFKQKSRAGGGYPGNMAASISLCVVVFLIGVPGNLMVSYVLGIKKKRNSKNNGDTFIVCLAVADLLASFFVPFVTIHDVINYPHWYLGEFMCYLLTPLLPLTLIASSWSLVLISLDRYRIIAYPFSPELSRTSKAIRITMVWLIAIVVQIPFILQLDTTKEHTCLTTPIFTPNVEMAISVCNAVVGWIIPALILAIIYIKIVTQLRMGEANHSGAQVVQQQVRAENKKVVRMFVIIVSIYLAFSVPFAILQAVVVFQLKLTPAAFAKNQTLKGLYLILPNITTLNCCVNPLVYARMHREINAHLNGVYKKVKDALLGLVSVKRSKSSYSLSEVATNKTCVSKFDIEASNSRLNKALEK
eukprot:gene15749-17338_t